MSSNSIDIGGVSGLANLLGNAGGDQDEGALVSKQSSQILAGGANSLTAFGAAGADLTTIQVNEALNIFILLDRSFSMQGSERKVTDGQNGCLDVFNKDRRRGDMMVSQWEFADTCEVLHPAVPLDDATRYGRDRDYVANGGSTRLFESWQDMLTAAVAQHSYNEDEAAIPTTTVCVLITDGGENHLGGQARDKKAKELTQLATDLLRSERFVLAFVGIDRMMRKGDDPKQSAFWDAALEMGFPEGCIGVDGDILKMFARISQSVSQVSSGQIQPGAQSNFFTT